MNIPIEIVGVLLAAILSAILGLQGWMLIALVSLKESVAKIKQQIDDK